MASVADAILWPLWVNLS